MTAMVVTHRDVLLQIVDRTADGRTLEASLVPLQQRACHLQAKTPAQHNSFELILLCFISQLCTKADVERQKAARPQA
jgi:hypothetical protein